MIMKKTFKSILFVTLVTGLTGCSDILDKGPLDKFTENDIWESPELSQAFLYPTLNDAAGKLIYNDCWTDNDVIQDRSDDSNINKEAIDNYYDAGWNVYDQIRKCNLMIQKMSENTTFMENDRRYLIAQAKALRGIIYYTRARLFGKLMIVDRVIDPDEEMQFPRTATIKDTYDFILKDLQEAAVDLPVSLNNQQGMLTKGAVYALIAEVALHGAAYIESGQEEHYAVAKKASEDLFALGQYELDTDYEKMFNDFDYALNSKEIILAHWQHETNTTFSGTWMMDFVPNATNDKIKETAEPRLSDAFEGWPSSFPSSDLVDTYEVVDEDGTAKKWNETSYYQNYLSNGGYVSQAIYKNRDHRFYATIVQDSAKYFNSIVTMRWGGNLHWDCRADGNWGPTLTGYIWRKGVYTGRSVWYSDPTYYHRVILRLGRSYLNYAEVMLRMGDINTAIDYINKTRTVHGGLPGLPKGLSAQEAWTAYKNERRVELVHEGDRYWSLLRWGKTDGDGTIDELNKVHHAISISADGKNFEIMALPFHVTDNERIFTKRRYLFPVPEGERVNNPSLDQNEGW